ncbi:MAG: hypothetical protein U0K81_06570 [Paludibacteraceae bacterium]|nr:hypothetical protein [Paludibacteraceae bacterium]
MAYCSQVLNGIGLDCSSSIGGIRAIYLANRGDIDVMVIEATGGSWQVASIEENGGVFHKYEVRKNSPSSMSWSKGGDDSAGTMVITTTIQGTFAQMTPDKMAELDAIFKGQFIAIVEDRNGNFWVPITTLDDYMAASAGEGTTGSTSTDANQLSFTLTGEANHTPYLLLDGEDNIPLG